LAEGEAWDASAARGSWRPRTSRCAPTDCGSRREPSRIPYYVIERPDAAIIFPLTQGDEVVLVRQYRPPLGGWSWACRGPRRRGREARDRRPARALEETGYAGGEWEALGVLASSPSLKDNHAHLFLARGVEEKAAPDPDEHELVEVVKAPWASFWAWSLGEIVSSSGVAAVMLALQRLGALDGTPSS
jgi:ADP-ribose pyrophosphatase